ncbi:hypothetical protein GCM10023310_49860 [Paenibacillus vulneris]
MHNSGLFTIIRGVLGIDYFRLPSFPSQDTEQGHKRKPSRRTVGLALHALLYYSGLHQLRGCSELA